MTPDRLGLLALQLVVVVIVGCCASDLLVQRVFGRDRAQLEWPERALAALSGFVAFAIGLMIGHLVTGGALFGLSWPAPAIAAALVIRQRRSLRGLSSWPWAKVSAAIALAGALFILPALAVGSGVRTGDSPWHLGWSEQLLAGEPVPTGPASEARNAYPWGFHALTATLVRLVPGSDPLLTQEAIHFMIVMGIPLAAAVIARRLAPRSGWAAAAASLIGGFGWVAAGRPDFITSPSQARYGADLVVASPNSMYELFPPVSPREVGLVILGSMVALVFLGVDRDDRRVLVAAGLVGGIVGLVSVPLFSSALLIGIVATAASARGKRMVTAVALLGPSLLTFGVWAGPVVSDYLRYGGFVNITPRLGVEWPLPVALASWGVLAPLAVGGLVVAVRSSPQRRLLMGLTIALLALLALAKTRGAFDWDLGGNATLLHQGRVWPVLHLLGSALAGVALWRMWAWVRLRARRALALGTLGAVFAVSAVSPVFAAVHLTSVIGGHDDGWRYARSDVAEGSFVRRAAAHLDPDDVVFVQGQGLHPSRFRLVGSEYSDELAFLLWQFSGCRLWIYDDARLRDNDLRIRHAELARRWDRRVAFSAVDADFAVVVGAPEDALETGSFGGHTWSLVPD